MHNMSSASASASSTFVDKYVEFKKFAALQGSKGLPLKFAREHFNISNNVVFYFVQSILAIGEWRCHCNGNYISSGTITLDNVDNCTLFAPTNVCLLAYRVEQPNELSQYTTSATQVLEVLGRAGPAGCTLAELQAATRKISLLINVMDGLISLGVVCKQIVQKIRPLYGRKDAALTRLVVYHLPEFASQYDLAAAGMSNCCSENDRAQIWRRVVAVLKSETCPEGYMKCIEMAEKLNISPKKFSVMRRSFSLDLRRRRSSVLSVGIRFFEAQTVGKGDRKIIMTFVSLVDRPLPPEAIMDPSTVVGGLGMDEADDENNQDNDADGDEELAEDVGEAVTPIDTQCTMTLTTYSQALRLVYSQGPKGLSSAELRAKLGIGRKLAVRLLSDLHDPIGMEQRRVQVGRQNMFRVFAPFALPLSQPTPVDIECDVAFVNAMAAFVSNGNNHSMEDAWALEPTQQAATAQSASLSFISNTPVNEITEALSPSVKKVKLKKLLNQDNLVEGTDEFTSVSSSTNAAIATEQGNDSVSATTVVLTEEMKPLVVPQYFGESALCSYVDHCISTATSVGITASVVPTDSPAVAVSVGTKAKGGIGRRFGAGGGLNDLQRFRRDIIFDTITRGGGVALTRDVMLAIHKSENAAGSMHVMDKKSLTRLVAQLSAMNMITPITLSLPEGTQLFGQSTVTAVVLASSDLSTMTDALDRKVKTALSHLGRLPGLAVEGEGGAEGYSEYIDDGNDARKSAGVKRSRKTLISAMATVSSPAPSISNSDGESERANSSRLKRLVQKSSGKVGRTDDTEIPTNGACAPKQPQKQAIKAPGASKQTSRRKIHTAFRDAMATTDYDSAEFEVDKNGVTTSEVSNSSVLVAHKTSASRKRKQSQTQPLEDLSTINDNTRRYVEGGGIHTDIISIEVADLEVSKNPQHHHRAWSRAKTRRSVVASTDNLTLADGIVNEVGLESALVKKRKKEKTSTSSVKKSQEDVDWNFESAVDALIDVTKDQLQDNFNSKLIGEGQLNPRDRGPAVKKSTVVRPSASSGAIGSVVARSRRKVHGDLYWTGPQTTLLLETLLASALVPNVEVPVLLVALFAKAVIGRPHPCSQSDCLSNLTSMETTISTTTKPFVSASDLTTPVARNLHYSELRHPSASSLAAQRDQRTLDMRRVALVIPPEIRELLNKTTKSISTKQKVLTPYNNPNSFAQAITLERTVALLFQEPDPLARPVLSHPFLCDALTSALDPRRAFEQLRELRPDGSDSFIGDGGTAVTVTQNAADLVTQNNAAVVNPRVTVFPRSGSASAGCLAEAALTRALQVYADPNYSSGERTHPRRHLGRRSLHCFPLKEMAWAHLELYHRGWIISKDTPSKGALKANLTFAHLGEFKLSEGFWKGLREWNLPTGMSTLIVMSLSSTSPAVPTGLVHRKRQRPGNSGEQEPGKAAEQIPGKGKDLGLNVPPSVYLDKPVISENVINPVVINNHSRTVAPDITVSTVSPFTRAIAETLLSVNTVGGSINLTPTQSLALVHAVAAVQPLSLHSSIRIVGCGIAIKSSLDPNTVDSSNRVHPHASDGRTELEGSSGVVGTGVDTIDYEVNASSGFCEAEDFPRPELTDGYRDLHLWSGGNHTDLAPGPDAEAPGDPSSHPSSGATDLNHGLKVGDYLNRLHCTLTLFINVKDYANTSDSTVSSDACSILEGSFSSVLEVTEGAHVHSDTDCYGLNEGIEDAKDTALASVLERMVACAGPGGVSAECLISVATDKEIGVHMVNPSFHHQRCVRALVLLEQTGQVYRITGPSRVQIAERLARDILHLDALPTLANTWAKAKANSVVAPCWANCDWFVHTRYSLLYTVSKLATANVRDMMNASVLGHVNTTCAPTTDTNMEVDIHVTTALDNFSSGSVQDPTTVATTNESEMGADFDPCVSVSTEMDVPSYAGEIETTHSMAILESLPTLATTTQEPVLSADEPELSCPWVAPDGRRISALYDALRSRVLHVVMESPGVPFSRILGALDCLTAVQACVLLWRMEEIEGVICSEQCESVQSLDGPFANCSDHHENGCDGFLGMPSVHYFIAMQ